jgi:gamma-glutamylcysteine synthetase
MGPIQLRGEGIKNSEIAKVVSRWVSTYCKSVIETLSRGRYGRNRCNMSFEEETQFLAKFETCAKSGQLVETSHIKQAYETLIGHNIGVGQIYRVLHWHGWRKVMPRYKH